MASVTLKVQISGTRNGEDWPAPGTTINLPDDEAASLIAGGVAVLVDEPVEEKASKPETGVETATRKPRGRKADVPAAE